MVEKVLKEYEPTLEIPEMPKSPEDLLPPQSKYIKDKIRIKIKVLIFFFILMIFTIIIIIIKVYGLIEKSMYY